MLALYDCTLMYKYSLILKYMNLYYAFKTKSNVFEKIYLIYYTRGRFGRFNFVLYRIFNNLKKFPRNDINIDKLYIYCT